MRYGLLMTQKPSPKPAFKPDDPEQYRRFLETAEEVEVDKDPKAFDRAFKNIILALKSRVTVRVRKP